MLGLRFCARAFSSCGEQGPLLIAVRGPLTIAASLVAEHRLQTLRLSSCGSRVQLLRGMWDLPRPGLEPVSPALAGGFSTTAPPGKPQSCYWCGKLGLCAPVPNQISETEFRVKYKRIRLLLCQAKGDAEGLCRQKLCVPTWGRFGGSFIAVAGGQGCS